MLKALGIGFATLIVIVIISLVTGGLILFQNVTLAIGVIAIILSGLLSGAFVSGDRARANIYMEDNVETKDRWSWSGRLFLFALPLIMGAVISYLYL
jgi:hypothetical protein